MRRLSFWAAIFLISSALAACAGQHRHGRRKGSTTARDVNAKLSNDSERARGDLSNLSAEQGKATYQTSCQNNISLELKASEKAAAYDQIVTKQAGRWQLIRVRVYGSGKSVNKQIAGEAQGPFAFNGTASSVDQPNGVTCHTNNSTVPATNPANTKDINPKATASTMSDPKTAINVEVKFPNEIQASDGKILSFAQLILQARDGRSGGQVRLTAAQAGPENFVHPESDGQKTNASVRTIRILEPDGHLVNRLMIESKESDGTVYTNFAEATYELKQ